METRITESFDWKVFDRLAALIVERFDGEIVGQLDGLDQRYWDIKINNKLVTLHLEHYTGISLSVKDNDAIGVAQKAAEELKRECALYAPSDGGSSAANQR